jgi:transposase
MERTRIKAVQSVVNGARQVDVAREFEVTRGAVSQWYARYRENGWEDLYKKPPPGRPREFHQMHTEKLYEIVSKSPWNWGYEADLWTVGMAREILFEQTGDSFSKTRVLTELHSVGFSFQKPQVRALEKKTTR